MSERFLVRFSGRYFFHSCAGSQPTGVLIPSLGAVLSYDAAFEIAQRLQRLGYTDACVATTRGLPTLVADITRDAATVAEEIDCVWSPVVPNKALAIRFRRETAKQ
jgi:hypothetical protein